ncbi:hypothetical protein [Azospirillum ramasamyi]|uniref:Uncharacterized protein n=1 Tax=Azospirillum ramasamyi TaxID=682998 RepID=A0A2U9S7D6_9PROT|nr:hypothetical protein [Azospirillum ramasamyi]AWU95322.1 hypothetical protein DM194_13325 [Azospirillum ramasamyi]
MNQTTHDTGDRSPSGLFRMSAWEGEFERANAQLPRWYWNPGQRRRHYARWVEAEAETLAMRLSGLLRSDTPAETAEAAHVLVDSLARDIDWARRLEDSDSEDGKLAHAA